ncbi:MAG: protein phosphatase 2C domain-containing protein [Mollicutes bacterium PWAP]|nr:protein phosphatase 2C domain-containing protein [Mollicutes bacterium PWAP]
MIKNHKIVTDKGIVRSENQDFAGFSVKNNIVLAVLCDGMGGHYGGSIASKIAVKYIIQYFEQQFKITNESIDRLKQDKITKWFQKVIDKIKKHMRKEAKNELKLEDMGTTLTALLSFNDVFYTINIGDSRVYVLSNTLQQLTTDHSLRNHYIRTKGWSPEDAETIVSAAALTSSLGPNKSTTMEIHKYKAGKGIKKFLLTSDGIHDYIPKQVIEMTLMKNKKLKIIGNELIQRAINGKSSDNLTAIVMEWENE